MGREKDFQILKAEKNLKLKKNKLYRNRLTLKKHIDGCGSKEEVTWTTYLILILF